MWGNVPKKDSEWGGGGTGWGDPRAPDPRSATAGMDPRDMRIDPRDMRAGSSDPMRMLDPREQMRIVSSEMRGDPRGITGRLNGSAETMWGQPPQPPHHIHHQAGKLVGPGGNNTGKIFILHYRHIFCASNKDCVFINYFIYLQFSNLFIWLYQ